MAGKTQKGEPSERGEENAEELASWLSDLELEMFLDRNPDVEISEKPPCVWRFSGAGCDGGSCKACENLPKLNVWKNAETWDRNGEIAVLTIQPHSLTGDDIDALDRLSGSQLGLQFRIKKGGWKFPGMSWIVELLPNPETDRARKHGPIGARAQCSHCGKRFPALIIAAMLNAGQQVIQEMGMLCGGCYGHFREKIRRILPSKKEESANMIKLFRSEKGAGIIADAKDEREFFDNLSKLLLSQIRENGKAANGNFQITLRQWLEQGTDIVCKLRGYKAETVRERRVFIAGEAEPRNEDMVAEIDEWAKEEEQ